jgi:hypothetical protein
MKQKQFQEFLEQQSSPLRLVTIDDRTYWLFQDRFYWENEGLEADEVHCPPRIRATAKARSH